MKIYFSLAVFFWVGLMGSGRAEITLAPLFTDYAVLQREKVIPIWGKASPGEVVTVEFGDQKKTGTTGDDGGWKIDLDPLGASSTERILRVSGSTSPTVERKGILVGDVWFASGQSNMQHILSRCGKDWETEASQADYPQIRMFKVWFDTSAEPRDFLKGKPAKWTLCQPNSVRSFSAVGYFFARDLFTKLGVPIGIIHSSWGGTQIESWLSKKSIEASPLQPKIAERWAQFLADYDTELPKYQKALAAWEEAEKNKAPGAKGTSKPREPQGPLSRWTPSGLFNAMVHPFIPYGLRGFIWYQGEANTMRHQEYGTLFKTLITDWRKDFQQGDLPFYFVQLANFDHKQDVTGRTWAFLREAQMEALSLPQTGAAITIDIGDPKDAHYANKKDAGARLAALALNRTYANPTDDTGPLFDRATPEGKQLRVYFREGGELVLKPGATSAFEVAGADRAFHPAQARVDGETLVVGTDAVPDPIAVRYAWHNSPEASLFDVGGLPAVPFRSDDWPAQVTSATSAGVSDSGDDAGN